MNARVCDPLFDEWVQRARNVRPHDVASMLGWKLRKSTATEWIGPCPACNGDDGFSISTAKNVFNCRRAAVGGGVIDMVEHALTLDFLAAVEIITGESRPSSARKETQEDRDARHRRAQAQREANERRERDDAKKVERKRRRDEEAIDAILARAVSPWGTLVEAYLRGRDIAPPRRFCGDLMFVPDVAYFGFEADAAVDAPAVHIATLPAMVAPIRNVAGGVIGAHVTYLDSATKKKWVAPWEADVEPKKRRNPAKKIRGEQCGGLIRLGLVGDVLAIAEGIETALSWWQIGAGIDNVSLAAGVSLGNMSGKCVGTLPHPRLMAGNGKPARYPNGAPDLTAPGIVLPPGVRRVVLIGDGDSEPLMTRVRLLSAGRRFIAQGVEVSYCWARDGMDFNDELRAAMLSVGAGCEGIAA